MLYIYIYLYIYLYIYIYIYICVCVFILYIYNLYYKDRMLTSNNMYYQSYTYCTQMIYI